MSFINNIKNKVKDKINERIAANEEKEKYLEKLKDDSINFNLKTSISEDIVINNYGKISEITEMNPNISIKSATSIGKILGIDEEVAYTMSVRDYENGNRFYIVFTTKNLIICDDEKYNRYDYSNVKDFIIVDKDFMTFVIFFMNNLIIADTNQNNITNIKRYINEIEFRNFVNNERKKYLLNTIPVYQKLNKMKSGISVDSFNNVIFHHKKQKNYGYRYNDIKTYELIENESYVIRKKDDGSKYEPNYSPDNCSYMGIKVTLINDKEFFINILEPTTFNRSYSHNDKTYLEELKFGNEIMDKLDSLYKQ